jgi:glycosyltransferase involved in cell wall biosynthesis
VTAPAAACRPLRILRVIARLNTGGPARHVVLLDRGLRARGCDTLLAYGQLDAGEGSLERLAEDARLPTARVPGLGRRISPLSDLRALAGLVRIVFRERPDIIHTHTAKAGALGRLAALTFNAARPRSRRALVVHTFHGHVLAGYFGPAATALVRFTERSLARITDRIVTISPAQRRDIVTLYEIAPGDRTVTIPLGLDLQPLLEAPEPTPTFRRELGIGDTDTVVGYVGRFVPIKDLPTLVEAFAIVSTRLPDAWLIMAGDGPVRPAIELLIDRLNLRSRVRLLGWSSDLVSLYATMDVCALSSLNEGTPVAAIEAMAAGRAVVATNVGGVPDVVENGRTGLLVPPRDAGAMASALAALLTDPAARRRMGEAAKELAASRFTVDRLVDDVHRLYESALAEKRGLTPAS